MAEVEFSHSARTDLYDIVDTIASDRPRAARRLRDRIVERCLRVAEQPLLAASHGHIREGVRGFLVGPYWVFFTATDKGIRIVRILHGRRDWQRLLRSG